ncbi:general substrate transporter [Emericellopsis atlantica]|uniref:General substrate transporter n=1 Tax=Emericellopsis atlantica TaxID=2614577 RepID=A0A9P8CN71_9HYPO|nr:general substrate transporter [Emericellopsis atlantica]KAG9252852.1 general substrate transporter [Emericellopsis atlantica]
MGKALGTFRAVYLVALCCVGSFLFAYDTGIVGGILTFKSFQRDFRYSDAQRASVGSNSTSLLQAGAFFACFFIWPFMARYGRRWSIVLASTIFNVGAVIQTINTHSLAAFYVARVISGVGVGMATVIIPAYSAEMAPKNIRGMLGSMFQFFFTLGVMTSYWIDYAVSEHVPDSTAQWQIPVGMQLVPGAILGLGMLLTTESVRWLAKQGRHEEAMKSLAWVRGGEDDEVRAEFAEILVGIEEEARDKSGVTWRELVQVPSNRHRLILIVCLQIGVQLTGNTSMAYYAPQIFSLVGAGDNKLLLTGFFGLVKVIACLFFLLFLVERLGRRGSLLAGALLMGMYMLIVAVLTAVFPPDPDAGLTPASIASLTMIYLEAMSYNISWGPVPWVYTGEIFPNRIREAGVALATATQWLFNFVFSQATPHAVENLGWKTFVMFSVFNFALVVFVWFFIKETKGKSLEQMDELFGGNALPDRDPESFKVSDQGAQHVDGVGQETVVPDRKD